MPDPFSILDRAFDLPDPFRGLGLGAARIRRPKKTKDELTEEEKTSLLRQLASPAMSGLAYVGETLDKPGAAVRGLLAGRPEALLNLIPFSDAMGFTDPKERTYGRDLLEQWGVLQRNRPGLDIGDVFGFGAEVALDPLTYIGLPGVSKALSAGGQVARKTGLLRHAERVATETAAKAAAKTGETAARVGPRVARMRHTAQDLIRGLDTAGDRLAASREFLGGAKAGKGPSKTAFKLLTEPLGGTFGASYWPMGATKAVLSPGFGFGGERIAGALDALGGAIRYSQPVRGLAALFQGAARGGRTKVQQQIAKELSLASEMAEPVAREKVLADAIDLHKLGLSTEQKILFRETVEGIPAGLRAKGLGELPPEATELAEKIPSALKAAREAELATGMKSPLLDAVSKELHGYSPREVFNFPEPLKGRTIWPSKGWDIHARTLQSNAKRRKPLLANHPGGTGIVQELSAFNRHSGTAWQELAKDRYALVPKTKDELNAIANEIFGVHGGRLRSMKAGERRKFAQWLTELDPRHESTRTPYYKTDIYDSLLKRFKHGEQAVRNNRAMLRMLSREATQTPSPGRTIPVSEALHRLGLTTPEIIKGEKTGRRPGLDLMREYLGEFGKKAPTPDDLRKWYVPEQWVNEMTRVAQPFKSPEEVAALGKGLDSFMNWWRATVTIAPPIPLVPTWPAFNVRNLASGQIANWFRTGVLRAFRNAQRTQVLRRTGEFPGALNHPWVKQAGIKNAAEASHLLARGAAKYQVYGQGIGQGLEAAGAVSTRPLVTQVPGVGKRSSFLETLSGLWPQSAEEWNPLAMRGIGGRTEHVYATAQVGEAITGDVEAMNRGGLWTTLGEQGYSMAEAARETDKVHVAYRNLTAADKAARRGIPFWTFAKGQAAFLAEELMERPGGRLAQFGIRAPGALRERDPFVPDYLAQTMAIPVPEGFPLIGPKPGGDPRYIGGLGMMHMDPLQFLGGGPGPMGTLKGFLQEAGARMGPVSKPIEFATGTSFFQAGPRGGRRLEDMDPTIGRLLANVSGQDRPVTFPGSELLEQAAMTFVPRPFTTARTLTDPRKRLGETPLPGPAALMNVLTGMKAYDLPQRTQEGIIREALNEAMRSTGVAKTFEKTTIPKGVLEELSESERREALGYNALSTMLGRRSRQRAAGEPTKPLRTW